MDNLSNLTKLVSRGSKRVGRGAGTGKGKTAGRGTKGQNARSKLSLTHSHFEGGQRPLMKRLPYRRGKGNSKMSPKPLVINTDILNKLSEKIIDLQVLIKNGLISEKEARTRKIKILGTKNLEKGKEIKIELPIKKVENKSAITAK